MTAPAPGGAVPPDDAGALEPEPAAVAAVFGGRLPLARRYAALLAGPGVRRGLIGPREASRLWTRHLLNCAVLGELVPPGARVVDIGSGAGLPGIALALSRPDLRLDLVEPLLRRSTFLSEVLDELGLPGCRVIRARADAAVSTVGGADVVTARAVAPLATLAGWAAPLLAPGGALLALKGTSAAAEVERDRAAAQAAGITDLRVRSVGADVLTAPSTVVCGQRRVASGGRGRRPR